MMFYIKICLFCIVLTLYQVEAEISEKGETTSTVEVLQSPMVKNATITADQHVLKNISNDIEIFDEKVGPQNEKQEEEEPGTETEVEEDEQPAAEEPEKEEEAEDKPAADADPEPEPTAEEEGEAAPEAEKEVSEEPEEEEISTESEKEPGTASEAAEDKDKPDDKQNSTEGAAENDDNEMPNDEPDKDDEQEKAAEDVTKHTDRKETSCFTCTSIEDATCKSKATQQMACLKTKEGDAGKHNGCYTLYQADKNVTMRGCVDELAEDGLKYCLENEKFCTMCYSNDCNDKEAPSIATKLQLNIFSLFLFAAFSLKFRAFSNFKFE